MLPTCSPAHHAGGKPLDAERGHYAYLKVLDMDPMHAAAHINLGTLYYNRQEYALAERHYRSAIQIDPRYASPISTSATS